MHQPNRQVVVPRRPEPARARLQADPWPVATTFFRDLVGSLRTGTIAITRDGRIATINDEARRILGLQGHAVDVGAHFADALRPCGDMVRILSDAFSLEHLPSRAELRLRNSGKVIGYTLSLVRSERGTISGAVVFFKDLTRVEQLEERERLRDRLAALGEMAAAIAHEVKNPLAGIEVLAGLLKRRLPDDADTQGMLNDIIQEAKMANAIVIEVLEFVRPIRLQVDEVALQAVVDDAVHMAESQVHRGCASVETRIPADLPPLEADGHQLRQLFTNLLTNAFEALGGRGHVGVRAWLVPGDETGGNGDGFVPPPSVVVDVSDDGPGIAAEARDRIFSPFFTTKPRGSGLGLAIVRKIVDAHEGRIDVGVGPRGGTSFRVTLPMRTGGAEDAGRAT